MQSNPKIKVLIVDDSLLFREVLARGIAADPQIVIAGKAKDPFDARDQLLATEPDVMICDVEMPKMNGIEFIRRLLPQYPLPIIVVSTINEAIFDALHAGAVDFVTKPQGSSPKSTDEFFSMLIAKIKIAAAAKVRPPVSALSTHTPVSKGPAQHANGIIAIGASTGGTEAIFQILKALPPTCPGIVIVQHIPPVFSRMFADRLQQQTAFRVKEGQTGDRIEPGTVLIAPGNLHMRVKRIGAQYKAEVFAGEKVNGHCPSVDILFESVASQAKDQAIGILLTGMGYDGAKGLLSMRRKGARTIGQDEASSVVYGMPKAAYQIGAVEKQVPFYSIPSLVSKLLTSSS